MWLFKIFLFRDPEDLAVLCKENLHRLPAMKEEEVVHIYLLGRIISKKKI